MPRPTTPPDRVDGERALVILRSAQHALLCAEDEVELLDLFCRIAVDEAGYRLAWVGFAEDDPERTVSLAAQAGYEAGYLGSITISWADTLRGRGPVGTAIRTGRPIVGRSFLTDRALAPWRVEAIERGFASALALPLNGDHGTFGALTIYSAVEDAFDRDDIELLSGLADGLALGITMLRTRAARGAAEEGLRRSERNLAEAQRIAHIGSWERDLATNALHWSDESHRMFGLEPGTFGGTLEAYLSFVHPDDRGKAAPNLAHLEAGDPGAIDYRIVRADGAVRLLHEEAEVIRDASGVPVRYIGSTQDITERVELEAQQTRFARLLDELRSEIYVFDAATLRFSGANAGALRNLGYSLDQLRELTPLELKPELTPASFAELLDPLRAGARDEVTFETLHRRNDGSTYPVEVRVHLLPTETPAVFVAIVQDITERVAADAERTRLVAAIEQTADSIWMQDLHNLVTYVNRAFSHTYGYEPGEIVGRHAGIVDSGRYEPAFFGEIWSSVAAGSTWTGSIVNRRKDGTLFEVEAVISGIRDATGRLLGYMQSDRDVTRERALESALEHEARERESIESALARIDPSATPEEIAAAACAEIVRLPTVASSFVLILDPGEGWVLATDGRNAEVTPPGSRIPETRLRYLRDRAGGGPWVERWQPRPEDGSTVDLITRTGIHSTAYAPFRCPDDTIGLIGIVAYDDATAALLVERLPALVTFGSIVGALIGPRIGVQHRAAIERAVVTAVIDATAFRPFFQPIVDLRDGVVVGYEALTRFDDGRPPDVVFAAAARAGMGLELETACLLASIDASERLPADTHLSLNASPELVLSCSLGPLFATVTRPIVLEITEHVAIDDYAGLRHELDRLGPTVRLAVDDAGAGYASFRHILELSPDFVKIDIGLVRSVHAEPARQALIAGMGYFAAKRGLHLVAEGIETAKELDALRALGVPYGQGYLLGRPRDGREPAAWPDRVALPTFARP